MSRYAQSYRTMRAERNHKFRFSIGELVILSLGWVRLHCSGYFSGALTGIGIISALSYTPSLFMNHSFEQSGIQLLSDSRLPENSSEIVSRTRERIAVSELYRSDTKFKIYLCNSHWLYLLASSFSLNSKGILVTTTGRIMIDMKSFYGKEDLVRCMAHEITHDMVRNHIGWRLVTTPNWVSEGYAEYVAQRSWSYCDVKDKLVRFRTGNIDPDDYGLYWLLVSYAIDVMNIPLDDLLRKPFKTLEMIAVIQTQSVPTLLDNLTGNHNDDNMNHRHLNSDRETDILNSCPG